MSPTTSTDDLLSVAEAARMMGVSERTLARYRLEGRLPYVRYSLTKVLYRRSDIALFIASSYREGDDFLE